MKYQTLAEAYASIERTASRLEMTDRLGDLFRRTPKPAIRRVVYLTQGKLYPNYEGIEIGVAEKLAVRAVAQATGLGEAVIARRLGRVGDLGTVAEAVLADRRRRPALTVDEVYRALDRAARAAGTGAQAVRLAAVAGLLRRATPLEARYLIRTVTGRLRLGVGDATVLDALAIAYAGGRRDRREVERAYNLTSDLGDVARRIARGGLGALRKIPLVVGKPIRPMLAERLSDPRTSCGNSGADASRNTSTMENACRSTSGAGRCGSSPVAWSRSPSSTPTWSRWRSVTSGCGRRSSRARWWRSIRAAATCVPFRS